jgi:MoaA/NifB/PqqE/SkfB family radical SAM enzyme
MKKWGFWIARVILGALRVDQLNPIKPLRLFSKFFYREFKQTIKKLTLAQTPTVSDQIVEDKYQVIQAMLSGALRTHPLNKFLDVFVSAVFLNKDFVQAVDEGRQRQGMGPPGFFVISPTKACNLRCPGCYANAADRSKSLDYGVFSRMVAEAKRFWGTRFFVVSGGEPLVYHNNGKGVLEIFEEHNDCLFLMYTNGTLIDDDVARRMARLGNVTPAISVEGMRERTDERRGEGTFDEILKVMKRLRRRRVVFGISVTATRQNTEEILSDEFVDFFFGRQGVSYGWLFHYMPIGRDPDFSLVPTPEQRVWMWRRNWEIIRHKTMYVDFWNQGTVSDGCIAGGREGGYFHVNWDGDVAPCVFFPYAVSNIAEVYRSGGTLNDVVNTPFFKAIRDWQSAYGFLCPGGRDGQNWLTPCPIRDHHLEAWRIIERHGARPIDYAPICSENYHQQMDEYDRELELLTRPIWTTQYQSASSAKRSGSCADESKAHKS